MRSRKTKVLSLFLIAITLTPTVISAFFINSAFALPALVLTAQSEKPFYYTGELVKIFGIVTNATGYPIQGAAIGIEVKDPNDNTIFIDGVWTQPNGYYEDSFRLSTESPIGKYNVYVTANKHGYTQASKQTSFYASTQQLGNTIVSIAGHEISLEASNVVKGKLNVTMFSTSIAATVVSNRFLLADPTGKIVHDNFYGIGTSQDYKLTTIYNSSITTINFQTTITTPQQGYYSYLYALFDGTTNTQYTSTSWIQGFVYTRPPVLTMNLGSLAPNSVISSSLTLSLKRFELAKFTFTLTQPVKSLQLNLGATTPSRFLVSINLTDQVTQTELDSTYTWKTMNLPAGTYDIKTTALSNVASLSSISLQSGPAITGPTVSITDVEATSASATPGGTMNYHVYVEWSILVNDALNVSASLEGTLSDSEESETPVLSLNQRDFYLTVSAPQSGGTYSVVFRATLKQAGIYAEYSLSLKVQSSIYNITIVNDVQYYRMPAFWEWLTGSRSPKYYDDANKLSVLSVTDVHIVNVGTDQNNNPVNATIELKARNRAGSWLSFGDGPHYDLWIEDEHDPPPFQLCLLIAGEPEETIRTVLVVDFNRRIDFKIMFKMSTKAEAILLAEGAFETLISTYVSGWTGELAQFLGDVVKLTALYYLKTCTETEKGYMVKDDIPTFIENLRLTSELTSDLIEMADKILDKNGRNPWLAVTNAVWDALINKRIDPLKFTEAFLRLLMWFCYRSATNWYKVIEISFGKARQIYPLSSLVTSWESGRAEWFIKKLGIIFSVVKLLKVFWDLWTMPPEEGKIVSPTVGAGPQVEPFDPVVSISYNGPASNTTIDYFGDLYSLIANITQLDPTNAMGTVSFIVDANMTSTYLPIISQPTFQRNLFKSLGLNATSTTLSWQNGSDTFTIEGMGSMFEGLHQIAISLNSTWIQGSLEMAADAIPVGSKALLNVSILYPFGKNLSYTIRVTLPFGSSNITVLSPGSYTIQDNIITWNYPVDSITVEFIPPLAHDISIEKVTLARTVVGQGFSTKMNLTLQNQGDYTETFNVTAYANTTSIATQTVTLTSGNSATITFVWNTSGFVKGNYTISAYAWPLRDETDVSDNNCTGGWILVTIPGDVDGNFEVDIYDVTAICVCYDSKLGPPRDPLYYPICDLDGNGIIDIYDVTTACITYGQKYP